MYAEREREREREGGREREGETERKRGSDRECGQPGKRRAFKLTMKPKLGERSCLSLGCRIEQSEWNREE